MKLMHNVTVYAMDSDFTTADAIVWQDDRIVAVGEGQMLMTEYPGAEKIDGRGSTVLPGFIDPHIHFMDGVLFQGTFYCSPENISTIASLKQAIAALHKELEKDQWIIGMGYDPWAFPGKKGPNRHDLDEVCSDRPVLIIHYSVHECLVNSKALAFAAIDRNTPQPFGGEIEKNASGEPTGRLIETAHGRFLSLARENQVRFFSDTFAEKLSGLQQMLFEYGITCIGDPAVSSLSRSVYGKMRESRTLQIPVVLYPCNDDNMLALPWDKLNNGIFWDEGRQLTTGPLKIFLDGADQAALELNLVQFLGSILTTLADCIRSLSLDPIRTTTRSPFYLGKDGKFHFGKRLAETAECCRVVSKAIEKNFTIAIHAIGNEAIRQALDILETAGSKHKGSPPPRIEHGLFLDDVLIRRLRILNVAVVTQPYFLTHMDRENVPCLPGIKQLPLRSLIDAGVRISGSSDWPVASCDPLLAIERAVTRITKGKEVLQKREAVTVREAVSMYTCWAAEILGCSAEIGTLAAGKRADFILLNNNPFQDKPLDWHRLRVSRTVLGGQTVFARDE